jgi:hypothetical protein
MAEDSSNSVQIGPMTIWWDAERGFIMVEHDEGAELDIELGRASSQAYKQVTGGKASPLFVDFSQIKSITKETRDYFSQDPRHTETYTAVALQVNNVLSRVLANFFMGINKPVRPTRVFDDRAKALEWLEQFRQ